MNYFKKGLMIVSCLGLFLLILAGCGESSAQAGQSKKIYIALDNNITPFTYADKNGDPTGLDYEVLKKIDDMLDDYSFEYEMVDYDVAAIGLEDGKYDLEAGDKYSTSTRLEKFLVSDSYYYTGVGLAVLKDSPYQSIEDLKGKKLQPVPDADGLRQVYNDYMKANPDSGLICESGSSLLSASDFLNGIVAGKWDAAFNDPSMFNAVLEKDSSLQEKIRVIEDPFTVVGAHFIINKNNTDLEKQINAAIKELKEDGTLDDLGEKWCNTRSFEKYADVIVEK
ncbi:MAG: transporter substrate-binding domain-containing protein [Streptococcaceae bacterium]|jgi:L-cystine transport system substrate-binding protein|nr:transporter substrate-binding domain-containing protein [Streptococcaceae bacterium]